MSSDRQMFHLDEVFDFRSGLSKPRSAFGSGFPFLTFKDVFYNYFVPKELGDRVQSSQAERTIGDIRRGDVFLTRTSETQHELGMSCVALSDVPDGTFNGFTKRLRPKPDAEMIPEYVGYYFRSHEFRQSISAISTLSTRASLNEAMLAQLKIELPSAAVQLAIGTILKSLDDKVAVLREMNVILEEFSRTLFRAWFVDFAPVRAKAGGETNFRGMPQNLFEVLPDSFELSEIGEIPKGWQVKSLDQIAAFLNGLAMQRYRPSQGEEGIPVIKISELRNGISDTSEKASESIPEKYKVLDGDFIFSWSGSLLAKFWIGGIGALNQHLFKVTSDSYPMSFVACWVWYHLDNFQRIAASKATTMGHIQRSHLSDAKVVVPGGQQLSSLTSGMSDFLALQIANNIEINTLIALRDTLLPKLISGELPAPDLAALGLAEASNGG